MDAAIDPSRREYPLDQASHVPVTGCRITALAAGPRLGDELTAAPEVTGDHQSLELGAGAA